MRNWKIAPASSWTKKPVLSPQPLDRITPLSVIRTLHSSTLVRLRCTRNPITARTTMTAKPMINATTISFQLSLNLFHP